MRLFTIILVVKFMQCIQSQHFRHQDIVETGVIMNLYLHSEIALWDSHVNIESMTHEERSKSILNEHYNFVSSYLEGFLNNTDFKNLINSYGWHSLQTDLVNVHRLFSFFTKHLKRGSYNKEESIDLTEHILNDSTWSLTEVIKNLEKVVMKEKLYSKDISNSSMTSCIIQRSKHQVAYQVYQAIAITELEIYILRQFSYMILNIFEKGNYTEAAKQLRSEFQERMMTYVDKSREVLENSDRSLLRCDPDNYVENGTYLQLTRLLQGYIVNEADLNSERSCIGTCSDYQFSEIHPECSTGVICRRPKSSVCKGTILFCEAMKDDMWICPSIDGSSRRYEYITYDDGNFLGKPKHCDSIQGFHLDKSWSYNVFWRCDHCFCFCDEQNKRSDRFFSLRPSFSDTNNNMVVTGIRFMKQNRIVHLQIQEGQLMKYGKVNASSLRWKPVDEFTILDKGIKDGEDYHTMTVGRRDINFDDLKAPLGHVVTGVQFRRLGSHLILEMRVSEINFGAGKILYSEKSSTILNENTEFSNGKNRRSEISLPSPDIPTRSKEKSIELSKPNTFMKFTHSSIDKDAAQTTVPFIDAQDVISTNAMALQGIGLVLKGRDGYGGFVAPKIETIDLSRYVKNSKIDPKNFI